MSGDTNWSSVTLLLRCNGSNGSTTFTDDSSAGRTITAVGNAQVTTTDPRWGTGAALFDGTSDRLTAAYASGLHLSTGDFTIEFWVRHGALAYSTLACFAPTNAANNFNTAWCIQHNANRVVFTAYDDAGSQLVLAQTSSGALTVNTWHHVAVTRSGNTFRLFLNGTLAGSSTSSAAIRPTAGTFILSLGALPNETTALNGRLDDIRITAGVARYTANFSAPAAEFPVGPPPLEARVQGNSALGRGQALAAQQYARVQGGSPLGTGAVAGLIVNAWVQGRSALGSAAVTGWQQSARLQGGSPLGSASALARIQAAWAQGGSALGRGQVYANVPVAAQVQGRSPLGRASVRAWHDFTGGVATAELVYVCDLITPTGTVRVPMSSWQATLQTVEANYAQVVLPGVLDVVTAVADATEFVVSRRGRLALGGVVEYPMVRAPVDTRSFSRGPRNYTAVLSGYFDALTTDGSTDPALTRTLQAVRSVTEGDGGLRIRCGIDWLLRPGMQAVNGATTLTVDFINYYVLGNDQYMDVGERA